MGNNIHANASGLNFTQPGKGAVTSTNEDCCCTLMWNFYPQFNQLSTLTYHYSSSSRSIHSDNLSLIRSLSLSLWIWSYAHYTRWCSTSGIPSCTDLINLDNKHLKSLFFDYESTCERIKVPIRALMSRKLEYGPTMHSSTISSKLVNFNDLFSWFSVTVVNTITTFRKCYLFSITNFSYTALS